MFKFYLRGMDSMLFFLQLKGNINQNSPYLWIISLRPMGENKELEVKIIAIIMYVKMQRTESHIALHFNIHTHNGVYVIFTAGKGKNKLIKWGDKEIPCVA
jgi:hypothetical protein